MDARDYAIQLAEDPKSTEFFTAPPELRLIYHVGGQDAIKAVGIILAGLGEDLVKRGMNDADEIVAQHFSSLTPFVLMGQTIVEGMTAQLTSERQEEKELDTLPF